MEETVAVKTESQAYFKKYWQVIALALILILSFWLNFYAITKNGYGNAYYAAAIKSMTESFKNFFFVSFDPAGMVSVDKPPLALWIQALFVLAFGYHGWVMLLPQELAGTASCFMLYILTAKYFGRPAGLLSALIFAITPIVVAVSRNNTMDIQLVFVLLAVTWFLFRSIEKSKWRYLFIAAVFMGLGFNIKMLQAYLILPAVVIVYLLFAEGKLKKRLTAGLISVMIMAAVSFAWVFTVDLYPAADRPYVGSSTNNTVFQLIFGHNGWMRLINHAANIGNAGILRLWDSKAYGQISWLIFLVLLIILVECRKFNFTRLFKQPTLKQGVFLYWAIWFATMFAFFSFAGFYLRYYLCMMAPAIAALSGIGIIGLIRDFNSKLGWRKFLLPTSLLATLTLELVFVWKYPSMLVWLIPLMVISGGAALILMVFHYFIPKRLILMAAVGSMLVSILAAPFYWSLTPVMYVPSPTSPYAGPELESSSNLNRKGNTAARTSGLEQYLVTHYKAGSFLVVANKSSSVDQYIIDTGLPAVAYGGFLGSDKALTLDKFKELVKEGKITYYLTNSSSSFDSYVKQHATLIDPKEYQGISVIHAATFGALYYFGSGSGK